MVQRCSILYTLKENYLSGIWQKCQLFEIQTKLFTFVLFVQMAVTMEENERIGSDD